MLEICVTLTGTSIRKLVGWMDKFEIRGKILLLQTSYFWILTAQCDALIVQYQRRFISPHWMFSNSDISSYLKTHQYDLSALNTM